MNRRGYMLLEAVVAASLSALLIVSALGALSGLQRSAARFARRASAAQVLRGTIQLLRSELGDLSPRAGEIVSFTTGSISYRATRGAGIACGASGGRLQVGAAGWTHLRQPSAGRDSLVLLAQPADTETVLSSSGPPVPGVCPDGVASMSLPYLVGSPDPAATAFYHSPLLLTETMEIRGYESAGEWWVGARSLSAGEVIQPALGPIAPNGLRFSAFDSTGTPTLAPLLVRHLAVLVKTRSGDSAEVHLDFSGGIWR